MKSIFAKFQYSKMILGICFTFIIALGGFALSEVPVLNKIGPLACAIILAILYRQFFGYPEIFRSGIDFTAKYVLRFAIILYGLKLNISIIFQDGPGLILNSIFAIIFAIFLMILLGKLLKANKNMCLLVGIGTGVCGAAAIAATAPIIKANEEDTAISIAMIALIGTLFSIGYTLILPIIPISNKLFGIWSGLSLHELAHVALAAEPAGENALAFGLLAKLSRVFLLVPVCGVLIAWMYMKNSSTTTNSKIAFPYFLLGFIGMSLLDSYVFGHSIIVSESIMNSISSLTTFLLAAAMVGLGLNVSLYAIRTKAIKPLIAMLITSVTLSFVMYVITYFI